MGRPAPVFLPGKPLQPGLVLALPESQRHRLSEAFGEVFDDSKMPEKVAGGRPFAAVGDITASNALKHGLKPKFIVVDFKTMRGPVTPDDRIRSYGTAVTNTKCPPGRMTAAMYNAVLLAATSKGTTRIEVDGEEDLAVMPAIIHLEPGASVIYGLPNRGATIVKVDEESRRVAREFLESFEIVSA